MVVGVVVGVGDIYQSVVSFMVVTVVGVVLVATCGGGCGDSVGCAVNSSVVVVKNT